MLSLTPTVALPGPVGVFTEYQFTETATGPSTVLAFAFENDDSFWSFDDVSVVNTPSSVPEPSSMLLLGFGLVGIGGFAKARLRQRAGVLR
jgi:hypothetical protein